MKDSYIGQAWLVLTLAVCFGAALAGVQVAWGPRIERNKENDARGQIPLLVPGAAAELTPQPIDLSVEQAGATRTYRLYRAMAKDSAGRIEQKGWVVKAKGPGYADTIELLIGLDLPAERITGLYVLAQNETPGLGNAIRDAEFRDRFRNKAADKDLAAVKGKPAAPNQIEAITGATVSSQSVCGIVNQAVADFRAKRGDLAGRE